MTFGLNMLELTREDFSLFAVGPQHSMAPATLAPEVEQLAKYFEQCGFAPAAALDTARAKHSAAVERLFKAAALEQRETTNKHAVLAALVAKDGSKLPQDAQLAIVDRILDDRLKSPDQIAGQLAGIRSDHRSRAPADSCRS